MTGTKLALDGGTPVRTKPFPPWPHFEEDEIEAAVRVMRSGRVNYWTGEEGKAFEAEFARFTSTAHAVALANGTVALEAALHALGVAPGDEVVVPCRTFIATASAVVARGAVPVVADVDPASHNVTADTIRAVLTPKTKAVIPVHLGGWPCDMEPILALAREKGLKVVEDCAQALGAGYKGKPVGSWGDAAAFSFCQDKIMTTLGEGGMVATNDRAVGERVWSYKDHGKNREAAERKAPVPVFRWVCDGFGTNGRMTEIQAAVGRVALRKVPGWVERRRALAARLTARLSKVAALRIPEPGADVIHVFYKYGVAIEPGGLKDGWTRDRILVALRAEGIPVIEGFCPEIQREKAFAELPRPSSPPANARAIGAASLTFPLHPTMTDADADDVAVAVEKVAAAAVK